MPNRADLRAMWVGHRSDGQVEPLRPSISAARLVCIVDSDLRLCEALSAIFRLEGYRTRIANDFNRFQGMVARERPDAVVVGFGTDLDGALRVVRRMRDPSIDAAVVALADQRSLDQVALAAKMATFDVLSKPVDVERLLAVVRRSLLIADQADENVVSGKRTSYQAFAQLTPRENEVLSYIISGYSSKETARSLNISPRTVEIHRANIMRKFGAKNVAHLVRIVLTA